MQITTRRRAGAATITLATAVVAAAALAGCTSSTGTTSSGGSKVSDTTGVAGKPTGTSTPQAAAAAVITTSTSGETPISPADPVSVSIANGQLTTVSLVNAAGKVVDGAFAADHKSWHTAEALGYGKTYQLTASGKNTDGVAVVKKSTVATVSPDNFTMPQITDLYGNGIGNGDTYGVGMIVRVHFDEAVNEKDAERALSVTTDKNLVGGWYWNDKQNAFWRPQNYYPAGTKVSVKVAAYGKKLGKGLYGQADKSVSFTIGEKRVSIGNGKTHQVQVYFSDKLVRTMKTSMGKGGYDPTNPSVNFWTMKGNYTVLDHENPATMASSTFGVNKGSPNYFPAFKVPYSTKISLDGIYLHEYNATANEQGHVNVSHGCLNLITKNAKWFYEHSRVGDVVQIVKSGGPTISFNQGGQWSVPWSKWVAGSALH